MVQLVIDRFEGRYAVCEDEDRRLYAIPTESLPKDAKEGCVLALDEAGAFSLDREETDRRRKRIAEMHRRLFRYREEK